MVAVVNARARGSRQCHIRHPGKPGDFVEWTDRRRSRPKRVCKLCKRLAAPKFQAGKPYGVIPLKWTPPEEIEYVSYC